MNLKEKCNFNVKDIKDLENLQNDIDNILTDCKNKNLSSDMFIKKIYKYLEKRPNIKNNTQKEMSLKLFAKKMAMMHIKTQTLYRILCGEEKNKEIIDSFKDEIKMFKEWTKNKNIKTSEISIEPHRTGGKVYDCLDKQIKETNRVISNMIQQTNMAQA